jgi:hypothetical protein
VSGSRTRIDPWPTRESLYPTLDLTIAVPPDATLAAFRHAARRDGYRVAQAEPGSLLAVLGRRSWSLVAETVGLPPVKPFLHVELAATVAAGPAGTVLRVTCGRGGQELGVATRVARLLERVLDRLGDAGHHAQISEWVSSPPA